MLRRTLLLILAAICALNFAACGAVQQARVAAKKQQMSNNLKELGLAYINFQDANNKAPTGWQDVQQAGMSTEGQQQLEAEGYIVNWGLKLSEAKQGTSNTIVAYHPNAKSEGGQVLLLDGSVQQLTGAEITDKLAAQGAP